MKRSVLTYVLTLLIVGNLVGSVSAFATESSVQSQQVEESDSRAKVVRWHYRTNNGVLEKRLWSITEGCWLTEWEPV